MLSLCNVGRFSHNVNKVRGNTMVVEMIGEHTVYREPDPNQAQIERSSDSGLVHSFWVML